MLGEKNSYICVRCMKCLNTPRILPLSTQLRLLSPFHLQSPLCVLLWFARRVKPIRIIKSDLDRTCFMVKLTQDNPRYNIYIIYVYNIFIYVTDTWIFVWSPKQKSSEFLPKNAWCMLQCVCCFFLGGEMLESLYKLPAVGIGDFQ